MYFLIALRIHCVIVCEEVRNMYAVKYPMFYSDADESKVWFTVCRGKGCDWVEEDSHAYRDDCHVTECPKCGCDDVSDESEYV